MYAFNFSIFSVIWTKIGIQVYWEKLKAENYSTYDPGLYNLDRLHTKHWEMAKMTDVESKGLKF